MAKGLVGIFASVGSVVAAAFVALQVEEKRACDVAFAVAGQLKVAASGAVDRLVSRVADRVRVLHWAGTLHSGGYSAFVPG